MEGSSMASNAAPDDQTMSLEQSRMTLIMQEKKRRAGVPADAEFERTFKRLKKQVAKGDDDFRNAIIDGQAEVQQWFDKKVAEIENFQFPPVDWATDVQDHGFYHKRTQELSPAFEKLRPKETFRPDRGGSRSRVSCWLIRGEIHKGITLGRVGEVEHPAFRLAELCGDKDAFTVFANAPVEPYTVLGAITGNVMTSGEFEEALTNDLSSERPKLAAYDFHGCRSDRGGWIQSNDEDDWLCLDDSQARNELSFIQDFRDDIKDLTKKSSRRPNVCIVEVFAEGWPMHLVVTVKSLRSGDELLCDIGKAYWTEWNRKMGRVRSYKQLNNQLNKVLDRLKHATDEKDTSEALLNPTVVRDRMRGDELEAFRKAAIIVSDMDQDKRIKSLRDNKSITKNFLPLHSPGTVDTKVFQKYLSLSVSEIQQDRIVLEVQAIVDNMDILLLKSGTYNENPGCAELVKIAEQHGMEIKNEAVRARVELDRYTAQVVPWDKKQQRPMSAAETILLLSVQLFTKSDPASVQYHDRDWECDVQTSIPNDFDDVLNLTETNETLKRKFEFFRAEHKTILNVPKPKAPAGKSMSH